MSRTALPAALIAYLLITGCGTQQSVDEEAHDRIGSQAADDNGESLPDDGEESFDLRPPRSYVLREGRKLYNYYCAPCHGETGAGDGFNAYNLDPGPSSLSGPEFQQDRSDDELARVIRTGGGTTGLSNGMPPWGKTLGERQIYHVVRYIRELGRQVRDAPDEL